MSHVPGSLVRARVLAPWLMALTGVVTILQFLVVARGEVIAVFGAFGIPTIGTTTLAFFLARKRWGAAITALLFVPFVHVVAASTWAALFEAHSGDVAWMVLIVDGVTAVLAFPALVACAVQGPRDDHDAGDVLLAFGGGWFAVEQTLCFLMAQQKDEGWMFAAMAIASFVVMIVGIARAVHRRAWIARVRRGLVSGWRVRVDTDDDAARGLLPLFGGHTALAVLERFELADSPYRSATVAHPVALVPAH